MGKTTVIYVVSSWCCVPKIAKNRFVFHGVIQK